jgi:hypothetical protein
MPLGATGKLAAEVTVAIKIARNKTDSSRLLISSSFWVIGWSCHTLNPGSVYLLRYYGQKRKQEKPCPASSNRA